MGFEREMMNVRVCNNENVDRSMPLPKNADKTARPFYATLSVQLKMTRRI